MRAGASEVNTNKPTEWSGSIARSDELLRLRSKVRELKKQLSNKKRAIAALEEECAELRSALLQQFAKTCNLEEWEHVKEEDFCYTMAEILEECEREQGKKSRKRGQRGTEP